MIKFISRYTVDLLGAFCIFGGLFGLLAMAYGFGG